QRRRQHISSFVRRPIADLKVRTTRRPIADLKVRTTRRPIADLKVRTTWRPIADLKVRTTPGVVQAFRPAWRQHGHPRRRRDGDMTPAGVLSKPAQRPFEHVLDIRRSGKAEAGELLEVGVRGE